VGATILNDPEYAPFIKEPIEVLGVDQFADSAVIIKARIKTEPIKQWMVGRELNRRFKKRFDELGIEIPFPHNTLYFGEASPPFRLELQETQKEGLREIVREVVREVHEEKRRPTLPNPLSTKRRRPWADSHKARAKKFPFFPQCPVWADSHKARAKKFPFFPQCPVFLLRKYPKRTRGPERETHCAPLPKLGTEWHGMAVQTREAQSSSAG